MAFVVVAACASALVAFTVAMRGLAVQSMTGAIFASAVIGGLVTRGVRRSSCLGFAASGGAYYLAAFAWPQGFVTLPTAKPLAHLFVSIFGPPVFKGPDDVAPFILALHNYMRVGHSLAALTLGLVGGLVGVTLFALLRGRPRPAPAPATG